MHGMQEVGGSIPPGSTNPPQRLVREPFAFPGIARRSLTATATRPCPACADAPTGARWRSWRSPWRCRAVPGLPGQHPRLPRQRKRRKEGRRLRRPEDDRAQRHRELRHLESVRLERPFERDNEGLRDASSNALARAALPYKFVCGELSRAAQHAERTPALNRGGSESWWSQPGSNR